MPRQRSPGLPHHRKACYALSPVEGAYQMSWARVSAKVHKWLALLMAIQILFWFVSGLFFAIAPIETVWSEHRIAELPFQPVSLRPAAIGLQRLAGSQAAAAAKIQLRSLLDKPVALVRTGEAPPRH